MTEHARWISVGRSARRVFIPLAPAVVQRYAARFYLEGGLRLSAAAIRCGLARQQLSISRVDAAPPEFARLMTKLGTPGEGAAADKGYVAFRSGTPGPLQKDSAVAISAAGQGLVFAKVARSAGADRMVCHEEQVLRYLDTLPGLIGKVPRIVGSGRLQDGFHYLATTVAPDVTRGGHFGPPQAQFLTELGRATGQWQAYDASSERLALRAALGRTNSLFPAPLVAAVTKAVEQAEESIGRVTLPMVLAHRDFAPWNTRLGARGLYVFDWEYAEQGRNPLLDFFHFHLMPVMVARAASGQRHEMQALAKLLQQGQAFAAAAYPAVPWRPALLAGLMLNYLIDLLLFYAEASHRFDDRDKVQRACADWIVGRDGWLRCGRST